MRDKDDIEVSSLADEVGAPAASPSQATGEGSSGLELDWGSQKGREEIRKDRKRAQRLMEVQAIDWGAERTAARELVKSNRGIWLVTKVCVAVLALRLGMSLFGAADANTFTRIVYEITHVLAKPFAGYLPDVPLSDGQVFEPSVLAALCGVFLLGAVLARLFGRKEWKS